MMYIKAMYDSSKNLCSHWVEIEKSIKQGCLISQLPFNGVIDSSTRKACNNTTDK